MPDVETSEFVEITHFINPHVFWLRKCNTDDRDFEGIEIELQRYAMRQYAILPLYDRRLQIERNDRVAVYFVAWKKWLRCDVDVINANSERCILWAIDYGFPLQSPLRLVVSIEDLKLTQKCANRITKVAISTVVPTKHTKNVKPGSRPHRERWASEAIDVLTKIKEEKLQWKCELQSIQHGQINLGELFVFTKNGEKKVVSEILIEMGLARPVTDANELLKSFEKTTKMDRWISNANQIHTDCILNDGNVVKPSAPEPEAVTMNMNMWQAPTASLVANGMQNGDSKKTSCSEDDVLKYFKFKRQNAQIAKFQSKTIDDAWITQQEKLNKSIDSNVESRSKKTNAAVALAYTSLNKDDNVCQKRLEPNALPATPIWPVNGDCSTQKLQNGKIVISRLQIDEKASEPSVDSVSKRMRISAGAERATRPQQKTDLRHVGEKKIQTTIEMTRILAHSEGLRIKPVESILQVPFTQEIHCLMKDRYRETYKSQAYAWPNLMRGNSLILVDSKDRGKTLAYLPALCSRLQINLDESSGIYNKTQLEMGPKAIILCANASSVENIAALCRWLMNRVKTEVVQAIGSRNIRNVAAKLFNGCSIFVTTAPCLLKLMKSHSDVFTAQKLTFFVFDNADMIINRYGEEQLVTIFKKFCNRGQKSSDVTTQVVATARTWHPALKRMRERILNPLLLIGNFLEAALYGNMDIQVVCNFQAKKMDLVHEHIKSLPIETERLIIICNEPSEANELSASLAAAEFELKCVTKINQNNKNAVTSDCERYWRNNDGIFVCTDETLKELRILNAQHIIHYSMPERFNDFLFRLSSSIECYPNENAKSNGMVGRASSLFLVDEKNNKQLPKLINLLERKGEKFPENVLEICQKIRILNDNEKAEKCQLESICNFLFMHGRSDHESRCRERHLLMPSDVPLPTSAIPRSGGIRLKILNIFSPTRYSVQLLTAQQIANRSWKPINRSDAYVNFNRKFNSYYSDSNNHRDPLTTELDNFCVVEDNDGTSHAYHRGRIIKIEEKRSLCANDFDVDVRLIDIGTIVRRKSTELRQLTDEFCDFPVQAIDLHLIGLVPADTEDEWDSEITQKLEKHLKDIDLNRDDIYVEANIVFSLRTAIVVDCLRIVQTIGCDCSIRCSVKKYMISERLGIGAKETRKDIIKMAGTIGIEVNSRKQDESILDANGVNSSHSSIMNDNAFVKSDTMAEAKDVECTPISDQTGSSVNLMEFSPMTSKASSYRNLTTDPIPKRNLLMPTNAPNENWATLSNSSVECDITLYGSPDNFFIIPQNDAFTDLLDEIDTYVEQYDGVDTSMEMPDIGNFCLAKINGKYNRAKILSNSCKDGIFYANVFCCDIGLKFDCEIEAIMSIPDSLLYAMPLQAIWCRLYGIKPTESTNGEWLEEIGLKVYDDLIDPIRHLTAKMISVHAMKSILADSPFEMQQINVVLMSSECSVNRLIVDSGWAEFEHHNAERIIDASYTLPRESNEIDSDDEESEDDEWKQAGVIRRMPFEQTPQPLSELMQSMKDGSFEIEFEFEEFKDCIDESMRHLFQIPNAIEAELKNSDALEREHKEEERTLVRCNSTIDSDDCEELPFKQRIINRLRYKPTVPYVTWQQSDELIMLSIKADENVAYNLDVTNERLIFNAVISEETNLLVLHFFGSIEAEYTSHEIRGLNVVVRLMKTIVGWAWPRLTAEYVKCHWLSYNYNAIRSDDIDIEKGKFVKDNKLTVDEHDSDDFDSDSDLDENRGSYDD